MNLPSQKIYSRVDKENPFALYCAYIDYKRPNDLKENDEIQKQEQEEFEQRMQAKDIELETCKNVCEMFESKENTYIIKMQELEDENARLEMELDGANYTLECKMGEITR